MLYICIPVHNEAPTIGVLLWRIRTLFQEYAREYEIVVYDDGSTDATPEVLAPYTKVIPLTLLRGDERRGWAGSVDALCRHVVSVTRYPRRDALVLMQGDFTDRPEQLPELAKRFEGGADIVVAQSAEAADEPKALRRLRRLSPWLLRPFVRVPGVRDLTSSLRLFRVSVLRDLLRARGDQPLARESGWAAYAEVLLAALPYARRVEVVEAPPPRVDVRPRESRVRPMQEALALLRWGWRARGAVPVAAVGPAADAPPAVSDGTATEPAAAPRRPRPPRGGDDDAPARRGGGERASTRAPRDGRPADVRADRAPAREGERGADRGPERGEARGRPARRDRPRAAPAPDAPSRAADDAGDGVDAATAAERTERSARRRRERTRGRAAADAATAPGDATASDVASPVDATFGDAAAAGAPAPVAGEEGSAPRSRRRRRSRGQRGERAERARPDGVEGAMDALEIAQDAGDVTDDAAARPARPPRSRRPRAESDADASAPAAGAPALEGDAPADGEAGAPARRRRTRRRRRSGARGAGEGGAGDGAAGAGDGAGSGPAEPGEGA